MTVITILLAGASAGASADPLAGYGEFSYKSSRYLGDLGDEFGSSWNGWQFGTGLRIERFAIGGAFEFHTVESLDLARHGKSLGQLGLGPEAKMFIGPDVGARAYLRAGYRWSWISGDDEVQRLCRETGQCAAGFWWEEPAYSGGGIRGGLGIEFVVPDAARDDVLVAFFLDAGYDHLSYELVGEKTRGGLLNVSIGAVLGGGRLR